jgi:hypothetical protein
LKLASCSALECTLHVDIGVWNLDKITIPQGKRKKFWQEGGFSENMFERGVRVLILMILRVKI